MNQKNLSPFFKIAVIFFGGVCFAFALFNLRADVFSFGFLLLTAFAVIAVPRLGLTLPRANFWASFSEPVIFLTFFLFGGEAAIILATLEMAATCFYIKSKRQLFSHSAILFNIFSTALSTTVTYIAWLFVFQPNSFSQQFLTTRNLIISLGVLALAQFVTSSILAAAFVSLTNRVSFWQIWKKECFSLLMTQIIGAGMAGVIYKLVTSMDLLTSVVAFAIFGAVYFYYRQSISEINKSIKQAEQAEREKAEAERLRAEQAEKYVDELKILLEKEEQTNEVLQKSKDDLEHSLAHDFLTNLPNRLYLIERLGLLIEIGIDISHKYFVMFMDLSRFKHINDSLGHTVGDRVLRLIGKRLLRLLRDEDTVARLGGDEFAIILNDLSSIEEARDIAQKIHEQLTRPFRLHGNLIFTDLNIGIAPFDVEHKKPEEILRDADIAMHHAKETGSGVAVFTKELRAIYLEKIKLEADLRFAVERKELSMHYQPIISLKDGELIGFEALLRWHHPIRGFISPAQFIPIAEDSGLIIPITKWILRETTTQLADWQKLSSCANLIVSVNISGKHLADRSLVSDVEKSLTLSKLSPCSLKLEITESAAMENAQQSILILTQLKELGVQLSIDDFGTGYSSLSYLHRLPFDSLKIDRSFIIAVGENGENSEILLTIMSLAQNLKMRVIAEGIETEAQLALLQNLGCHYGQGYLMSKPLPKDEMEKLLYLKRDWLPFSSANLPQTTDTTSNEENHLVF